MQKQDGASKGKRGGWRCRGTREGIARWLEVPESRRVQIRAHARSCGACAAELERAEQLAERLDAARRGYRTLRFDGELTAGALRQAQPRARKRLLWTGGKLVPAAVADSPSAPIAAMNSRRFTLPSRYSCWNAFTSFMSSPPSDGLPAHAAGPRVAVFC